MFEALYLNENDEKEPVSAKNITPTQNENKYKGRLFCENPNCTAELVYHERQKGKFIRYFTTLPNSKHIPNCKNEIINKNTNHSTIIINGEGVNVSDQHIQDSLKEGYKKFSLHLHPKTIIKLKKKPSNKKIKHIVPRVNKKNDANISYRQSAITNGKKIKEKAEREPYIYKRELEEIKTEDKKNFREVNALIDSMRITEDEAYIEILGYEGKNATIYFGYPFKTQYPQEFELLSVIKEYIDKNKENNKELLCSCFGGLKQNNDKLIIELFNFDHMRINNKLLMQIVRSYVK